MGAGQGERYGGGETFGSLLSVSVFNYKVMRAAESFDVRWTTGGLFSAMLGLRNLPGHKSGTMKGLAHTHTHCKKSARQNKNRINKREGE